MIKLGELLNNESLLKSGIRKEFQDTIWDYNAGKINRSKLKSELERLQWKSRGSDPDFFPVIHTMLSRLG